MKYRVLNPFPQPPAPKVFLRYIFVGHVLSSCKSWAMTREFALLFSRQIVFTYLPSQVLLVFL